MRIFLLALTILAAFPGCKKPAPDATATTAGWIEKDYLVKGMYCAGCVISVKIALARAGIPTEQIIEVDYSQPDPANHIGHVKLRFSKDQYRGLETDCRIVTEIFKSPGYTVYWDPKNLNPCK